MKKENLHLILKGSETAKSGFKNEFFVVEKFNNWKNDLDAQEWLKIMGYELNEIEKVEAHKIKGSFKADIQAKVKIYLKNIVDAQNLSVKLTSNEKAYNQIDKRLVEKYINLWDIPKEIADMLKEFTGEIEPINSLKNRDIRRKFLDEMHPKSVQKLIDFFENNKITIISDLIKGRGKFSAEWMLVIKNINNKILWALKPINLVMNYYGSGKVEITKKGSLKIGKITMQRKGGDNGRDSAKMLQFKINPNEIFNL